MCAALYVGTLMGRGFSVEGAFRGQEKEAAVEAALGSRVRGLEKLPANHASNADQTRTKQDKAAGLGSHYCVVDAQNVECPVVVAAVATSDARDIHEMGAAITDVVECGGEVALALTHKAVGQIRPVGKVVVLHDGDRVYTRGQR